MSNQRIELQAEVPPECAGKRLDQTLAHLFPEHSRSRLKQWIETGYIRLDGVVKRPKDKVLGGEHVVIAAWVEQACMNDWHAEALPLQIIAEDEAILVINKPSGLVVHPASGHSEGTLVNALLHHFPQLIALPRAGLVHRLDKDTTGLLVIAKTREVHTQLVLALQARTVVRVYEAIVQGTLVSGGTVVAPIWRHPHDRKRMAVVERGKEAITHYRVLEKFQAHTHLQVQLETGRTHQIRVHMAHLGHHLVGDKTYGGRPRVPPKATADLLHALQAFPRQALHATRLALIHPLSGQPMSFEAPLAEDMSKLLLLLRKASRG